MFERFGSDARGVVVGAQSHARRLGHRPIDTEHLLLALLDGEGRAATALRESGLTAAAVEADMTARRVPDQDADRQALAAIGIDLDAVLASVGGPLPDVTRRRVRWPRRRRTEQVGHLPFGRPAKTCLELALREALRLGSRTITADHVLLGLLRNGDGPACRIIVDRGASIAEVRRRVEDGLRRPA